MPNWAPRDRLRRIRGGLPDGKSLPDNLWLGRHRAILLLLWLHVPAITIFAVASAYGVRHTLVEGSVVAILAATASVAGRKTGNRHILSTIVAL